MKKEDFLKKLREHNVAQYKGDQAGTMKASEVRSAYEENLEDFMVQLGAARNGTAEDKYGRKIPPRYLSLVEALQEQFCLFVPEVDEAGKRMSYKQRQVEVIRKFLRQLDVFMGADKLGTIGQRFGIDTLNVQSMSDLLVQYSNMAFANPNTTKDINADYRFILPELIHAAIRIDYEGALMSNNWIANTINISQRKLTMPQILRGNTGIRKIEESESIPFGTVRFGQKEANVFKVGTGFKLTDELINDSTLDMLFLFLGEVGIDMSIGADVEAMSVLINGEQTNGDESCPTIGVQTVFSGATPSTTGVQYFDLKRGISRMQRLKRNPNRIITGETTGLYLTGLSKFEGFDGPTKLSNLESILGVPERLVHDTYYLPDAQQVMVLAPDQAMAKLQYRSMKTETRRNPQNQEEELFVSDHIGYAIVRRDARLIIDGDLAYGSPDDAVFPSFMDVDARINQAFKNIQGL